MTYNKIDYYLRNFTGSISLLGSNPAPKLRLYYSTVTSFHLSRLYNHDLSQFEYDVQSVLNQMKACMYIYKYSVNIIREHEHFGVNLTVSPLFSKPETLNVYSTFKSQAEAEEEWNGIKIAYAELLA